MPKIFRGTSTDREDSIAAFANIKSEMELADLPMILFS